MKQTKTTQSTYKWGERKQEHIWTKNSPEKFKAALDSDGIKLFITNCKQHVEAGLIESSGIILQNIFQKAAELSLEKKEIKNTSKKKIQKIKKNGLIKTAFN